jgi:hypothetical protein
MGIFSINLSLDKRIQESVLLSPCVSRIFDRGYPLLILTGIFFYVENAVVARMWLPAMNRSTEEDVTSDSPKAASRD